MDTALATCDSMAVEVIRNLMRCKRKLLVATTTVREDAWRVRPLQHLKKTLALESCYAARNAIRWNHVDPYTERN